MRTYDLRLRRSLRAAPEVERLEARDDGEARALAELRLKLTGEFAEVVLADDQGPIVAFTRDSLNAGGRG